MESSQVWGVNDLVWWLLRIWLIGFYAVAGWIVWSYSGPSVLRFLDKHWPTFVTRVLACMFRVFDAVFPEVPTLHTLAMSAAGGPPSSTPRNLLPFSSRRPESPASGPVQPGSSTQPPAEADVATPAASVPAYLVAMDLALSAEVDTMARAIHRAAVIRAHGPEVASTDEVKFENLPSDVQAKFRKSAEAFLHMQDPYRHAAAVVAANRVSGNFEEAHLCYLATLTAPAPVLNSRVGNGGQFPRRGR